MRLRAVIIDDEETGIEILKLLIEKHIPELKVVGEASRPEDGIELIENYTPEIVFLDISMPQMNGFELLDKLEWKNFNLIFTTAHQEHALRALKLSAKDYLLKPVDHKDLRLTIDRIKEQLSGSYSSETKIDYSDLNNVSRYYANKLGVNSKEGVEYVDPVDIISLESSSNYTKVCLSDSRIILCPKTLREFENQLCNNNINFMRVHHSFLINLHKVLRYIKDDENIIMVNDQKIPLSKSRREAFYKWLNP